MKNGLASTCAERRLEEVTRNSDHADRREFNHRLTDLGMRLRNVEALLSATASDPSTGLGNANGRWPAAMIYGDWLAERANLLIEARYQNDWGMVTVVIEQLQSFAGDLTTRK